MQVTRPFYIAYRVGDMLVSLLSRFINAAFLGGSTHQTTSARMHIENWPRGRRIINALFFWQADHCAWAWQKEVAEARRTLDRAGAEKVSS